MPSTFNFAQRAYQVNQAYGSTVVTYNQNNDMAKITAGNNTNLIGVADTLYANATNKNYMAHLIDPNVLFPFEHPGQPNPGYSIQHQSNDLSETYPGPPIPQVNGQNSGSFGGSCYPASLGNPRSWNTTRNYADGMFVTAGYDGLHYSITLYRVDSQSTTPQLFGNLNLANVPGQFYSAASTTNCRVFAAEGYDDQNLMAFPGNNQQFRYITVILFLYDNNSQRYDWWVCTIGFDADMGIMGQIWDFMFNEPGASQMAFPLPYSGKLDIIYPSDLGDGSGLRKLIISPTNDSKAYAIDVQTGSGTKIDCDAMAYNYKDKILCTVSNIPYPGAPYGWITTYDVNQANFLGKFADFALSTTTKFFSGDWHPIGCDMDPGASTGAFYFGDIGDSNNRIYKGWSVWTSPNGTINTVSVGQVQGPTANVPFGRLKIISPFVCAWGVPPNYSNQVMIRVPHRESWFKPNYYDYASNSVNEDFIIMDHPDCLDFAGQPPGGYQSGVLAGLPSGAGNGHLLVANYANRINLIGINYANTAYIASQSIGWSNHHNYVIAVGAVPDPTNAIGTNSYYYISISGLSASYTGSNGCYNIIKFWGN